MSASEPCSTRCGSTPWAALRLESSSTAPRSGRNSEPPCATSSGPMWRPPRTSASGDSRSSEALRRPSPEPAHERPHLPAMDALLHVPVRGVDIREQRGRRLHPEGWPGDELAALLHAEDDALEV